MSTHSPNLWRVLSDTSRIISAHSRHFFALSVIFLFPISFANTIYLFLSQPTPLHSHYRRFLYNVSTPDSETPPVGKPQLLIQVLYFLFVLLFGLCANSSITYSTFRGFYGMPVKFISSLKSTLVSFFPLLATKLITQIILGLIFFAFGIFMLLPYTGLVLLGFNMGFGSAYFLVFVILITALLVGLVIYLQIEWYLTTAVVVVESQWGFAPLKRSWYLVKGMRGVVFLIILFFGILYGLLSIWYWNLVAKANTGRINEGCTGWWVVLQMVVYAGFSTILSLYGLVANTVLFVYCKELHGESAFQIDEEIGGKYVQVPFDIVNAVKQSS